MIEELLLYIPSTAKKAQANIDLACAQGKDILISSLKWLTHTTVFENWVRRDNGTIWNRTSGSNPDCDPNHVAALVSALLIMDHYQAECQNFRILYWQCHLVPGEEDGAENQDKSKQIALFANTIDIMWSLICQVLLLNCQTSKDLRGIIGSMPASARSNSKEMLRLGMNGTLQPFHSHSLFRIFEVLLQKTEFSMNIAIDKVENIAPSQVAPFFHLLQGLLQNNGQSAHIKRKIIISGTPTHAVGSALEGSSFVDQDTECIGE